MFLEFLQALIFQFLELLLFFVVLGAFIQIIVSMPIPVPLEMFLRFCFRSLMYWSAVVFYVLVLIVCGSGALDDYAGSFLK